MFKILLLDKIPPEDELAPGIVVFLSILNGLLFVFLGRLPLNSFNRKETR
jgi:hypothetical protein